MVSSRDAIISQLQKDTLLLQGFKTKRRNINLDIHLVPIRYAFPGQIFPSGAVHEFLCFQKEHRSATIGFICSLIAGLMQTHGACVWISSSREAFPPGLKFFGINPEQVVFIQLKKERDILWAMEEALKCEGLASVIGEIKDLNFTNSRRLQLAVENSKVTGFILHQKLSNNIKTCVSSWKITSVPSFMENGLPGVGFPRWNVELLKIRNGSAGCWQVEWRQGKLNFFSGKNSFQYIEQKKTG